MNSSTDQPSIVIEVKVVPRSSRDRIAGRYGQGIKVQTTAPPESGRANAAVARLLAEFFGLSAARVILISSPSRPQKRFRLMGIDQTAVAARMAKLT